MKKIILSIFILTTTFACNQKDNGLGEERVYINTTIEKNDLPTTAVLPVNEAKNDTLLTDFLSKLELAVTNKDTTLLYSLIDTDIIISHSGEISGIKEFRKDWELSQATDSKLWNKLSLLLKLGGAYEIETYDSLATQKDTLYRLPYSQANKFLGNIPTNADWLNLAAVIAPKADMYAQPEKTEPVAQLNYDIVEILEELPSQALVKVKTTNNAYTGYVKREDLYYLSDYMLDLKKKGNQWKIVSFAPYN